MSHELEIVNGVAQIAYVGEVPWHGLGVKVPADLTPEQMLEAAGLDWEVEMRDNFTMLNGKQVLTKAKSLVRLANGRNILEEVVLDEPRNGKDWKHTQNLEAFEFYNELVAAGVVDMHTAGSLFDGRKVWALAQLKESFELINGKKRDEILSFLLLTNPHQWGSSRDIRFTGVRVVCNNTHTMAMNSSGAMKYVSNHRKEFNKDEASKILGLSHYHMNEYKEKCQFLVQKKYNKENIVEFFKRVFPLTESKKKEESKRTAKELHKGAEISLAILDTQPGADFAPGTWWNAYNASTFYVDHLYGKNNASRMQNAWYGRGEKTKQDALDIAVEMASAC